MQEKRFLTVSLFLDAKYQRYFVYNSPFFDRKSSYDSKCLIDSSLELLDYF